MFPSWQAKEKMDKKLSVVIDAVTLKNGGRAGKRGVVGPQGPQVPLSLVMPSPARDRPASGWRARKQGAVGPQGPQVRLHRFWGLEAARVPPAILRPRVPRAPRAPRCLCLEIDPPRG